jgi:hypothetical protein
MEAEKEEGWFIERPHARRQPMRLEVILAVDIVTIKA